MNSELLPEHLATQARELFRHLPAGEVAEDESLAFRTDDQGNLLVAVPSTQCNYRLKEGLAWRVRKLSTGEFEVTCWQRGELCESRILQVEHEEARWN